MLHAPSKPLNRGGGLETPFMRRRTEQNRQTKKKHRKNERKKDRKKETTKKRKKIKK